MRMTMECVICGKSVTSDEKFVMYNPTTKVVLDVISVMEKRQDKFGMKILLQSENILCRRIKIKYRYECRKSYRNERNIQLSIQTCEVETSGVSFTSRGDITSLDVRSMCLIYSRKRTKNRKKLISVQTGEYNFSFWFVILFKYCRIE